MARLMTRRGVEKVLRRIMETGGMTEDMETDIRRLKDELDEREGLLRCYGETYDDEYEEDEYEYRERERREDDERGEERDEIEDRGETMIEWKSKYDELSKRYMDSFFTTPEKVKEDQRENVREDGEDRSYEKLFEEREG